MMGRKQKLINGDEHDVVGAWRKVYCYLQRAGVTKKIKTKLNKRFRRQAKEELREYE